MYRPHPHRKPTEEVRSLESTRSRFLVSNRRREYGIRFFLMPSVHAACIRTLQTVKGRKRGRREDRRNHGSDVQELMVVMGLLGIEWQKTGVYGET